VDNSISDSYMRFYIVQIPDYGELLFGRGCHLIILGYHFTILIRLYWGEYKVTRDYGINRGRVFDHINII
jgi:hypothetical protein